MRQRLPFDSHGHVVFGGLQALSADLLAPPDGDVTDISCLKATLSAWAEENAEAVQQLNMVIGFGYENAQLAGPRHSTRQELDQVSDEIPILLVHQSGHLGVANSAALEIAGIDASSEAPLGGVIRRIWSVPPRGSGRQLPAARSLPVAVPYAYVLLGRLAPRSHGGPVNAENISPTGWVRERGMMFGSSHDAPFAFPDSRDAYATLESDIWGIGSELLTED